MEKKQFFLESAEAVASVHIPRWDDLPQFDLYIDQVIALTENALAPLYVDRKGLLTPSMINNYVKSGVLPAPVNKKYNRTHLALLMILCAMKPVMEISAIADVIGQSLSAQPIEVVLEEFAKMYESELALSVKRARTALAAPDQNTSLSFVAIENTLRASAARTVALHAYRAEMSDRQTGEEERERKKEEEKLRKEKAKEQSKKEKESKKQKEKTEKPPKEKEKAKEPSDPA